MSVPGGSAIVQAIVIADDFFERYRRHPDFIQTYVFPGGMLLSPASLREQCRQAGLKIAELYSFGLDYARTLETWLGRFDRVADQVGRSWASTSVSAGCGGITLPIVPQASRRAARTFCRHTSGIYNCRQSRGRRSKVRRTGRLIGVHAATSGHGTAASVRLSFDRLVAYSTLSCRSHMAALPVVLNVSHFYGEVLKVPLGIMGAIFIIARIDRRHPGSGDRPDQRPLHPPRPARPAHLRGPDDCRC